METSVRSCVLPTTTWGSYEVGEDTQSIPFGKHHIRRCMGMWLSNGLHHLWCGADSATLLVKNVHANSVVVLGWINSTC